MSEESLLSYTWSRFATTTGLIKDECVRRSFTTSLTHNWDPLQTGHRQPQTQQHDRQWTIYSWNNLHKLSLGDLQDRQATEDPSLPWLNASDKSTAGAEQAINPHAEASISLTQTMTKWTNATRAWNRKTMIRMIFVLFQNYGVKEGETLRV
jgi:hypothetical protein